MKATSPHSRSALLGFGLLCALLALIAAAGCKSAEGDDGSHFASVVITNRTATQILQTTVDVFRADGFEALAVPGGGVVFDKRGSRANDWAYGGWIDDRTTRLRVKVGIVPQPGGALRLQCQAYVVAHPGDSFFQEERVLPRSKGGPYRKLLEEVARRLK